jgi:hypothetical protein
LVSTHSPTPLSKHPAQVEFDDMVSPRGRKWRAAFDVLLALNLVAPPDDLFADRYTRFDDAFGTELTKAHAWINAMQRRFF